MVSPGEYQLKLDAEFSKYLTLMTKEWGWAPKVRFQVESCVRVHVMGSPVLTTPGNNVQWCRLGGAIVNQRNVRSLMVLRSAMRNWSWQGQYRDWTKPPYELDQLNAIIKERPLRYSPATLTEIATDHEAYSREMASTLNFLKKRCIDLEPHLRCEFEPHFYVKGLLEMDGKEKTLWGCFLHERNQRYRTPRSLAREYAESVSWCWAQQCGVAHLAHRLRSWNYLPFGAHNQDVPRGFLRGYVKHGDPPLLMAFVPPDGVERTLHPKLSARLTAILHKLDPSERQSWPIATIADHRRLESVLWEMGLS